MIQLKNQKLIRGICDKTPYSIVSGDKENKKKIKSTNNNHNNNKLNKGKKM